MKTAFLVVDVQKFFMHDAPKNLVGDIYQHMQDERYDVVAFTVFQNTPKSNFVKSLQWSKCSSDEDAELPPEFQSYVTAHNVFKRYTYSGFSGTTLNDYLQERGIEKVVLCGVDTEACVLATAFGAFDAGYLLDVNAQLTFSGGHLESEARAIMKRSLIAH